MLRRSLAAAAPRTTRPGFTTRHLSRSVATNSRPAFAVSSTQRRFSSPLEPAHSLIRTRRLQLRDNKRLFSTQRHTTQEKSENSSGRRAAESSGTGLGKIAAVLAAVGVGGGLYYYQSYSRLSKVPDAIVEPIVVPEKFVHPYDSRPWYWRAMFRAKRFLQLALLWMPCAAVSVLVSVTDNEAWRKYWIGLLVSTLEAAGCTFQKFGQWLSMRPDIFPPDIIEALANLRDHAPAHEYKHTRRMVKESFGREVEEIFEIFEEEPVASGTVAQVHRAVLREDMMHLANVTGPDGKLMREVAVKVRHPHVLEETWMDLDLLFTFINSTNCMVVPFRKEDFSKVMQKQLDFTWEAHNLQRFSQNFQAEIADGVLHFPTVSTKLLSPSILIESWANGSTVSDIFSKVDEKYQKVAGQLEGFSQSIAAHKRRLARTVFDMNMKMFLRDNLVHGDLHGGNVLFSEKNGTCTVLDAGLTTSIEPDMKKSFGQFLHALCTGDSQRLVTKLIEFQCKDELEQQKTMTPAEKAAFDERVRLLEEDLTECLGKFIEPGARSAPDGSPISLGDVMGQLVFALQRHDIWLRGDVASSIMTMSVSEGLIRSLDPDFDVVANALPYFVKYSGWASTKAVIEQSS